ncbi:MutT/NUDIX family NTP pyrophosphohydrolase [Rhizobium sp. CF080]|uniref:hypothetical protein n=1 Tax=Rhizobium sp. (strain CF080) TaxID=1144310 RepID=UPI0002715E75|nr:hypothetical protein [Rhizobium sp. CF080]EUB98306.1 MutT/NUDIX family NTP pyrophosphohydrolase [Rhizobium sp. CF080]
MHEAAQNEVSNEVVSPGVAQVGALCYRRDGEGHLEVLLLGSRRGGRWGPPKGHIESREHSGALR